MSTTSARHRLGSWVTRSGNAVAAHYEPIADGLGGVLMVWDVAPPLPRADHAFYVATIQPDMIARWRHHVGQLAGATLVLTP